ncbi:mechanosensitive ion channel family protein [Micromonospora sp. MS34]|uniref:mechanosensitive ion channel family protein n=1 Tax=Micromonospora sp. MS34 TaxID=3385971 RepID=UPI00399F1C86
MTLVIAASIVGGGVVLGLVLRLVFGWLAHHANGTAIAWDDLGWALLRDVALPSGLIGGLWWASQVLRLPQPARGFADRILLAAAVFVVALAAARLAGGVVRTVTLSRSGVSQSASIFVNITRVVILAIGVLVILQSIGVSITPLLTALGVGGLAVALALQDTLANLFAGIQVLASKKVRTGDFIQLDTGEAGYVVDINWRNTTVRQLAGNIVVVPNAKLADTILTNYHQPLEDLSVLVQVGVSYDSDLDHVERVTIEVGRDVMTTVDGGVRDHEPFIRYHTFGDSSINFSVILRATEYSAQYLITHEFIKRLHRRYRAEGIEIPFPIRTLVMPGSAADPARPAASAPAVPAARNGVGDHRQQDA